MVTGSIPCPGDCVQRLGPRGRALDSSPNSSTSGPNRLRAANGSSRVRIEARDESWNQQTATAKTKTKNAKKEKTKNALTKTAVS